MPGYQGPCGETDRYRWANIEPGREVEVEFDIPAGCRQRDIDVKLSSTHVTVSIMGTTLVDDELLNRCDPAESQWVIRGTRLVLALQKANGSKTPWPSVFLGDCKKTFDFDDVKRYF
mmetsp:Transcript_106073/g.300097  ORF Transcript_106073/g.300097 Transcript_106073/m.300097 type:complete len:117 (-) Transcript_106073:104-454(-)